MLVLSRRAQQQISFPNLGVTLSILQVRGKIVKVGIEAPPEIAILRQETVDAGAETSPAGPFGRAKPPATAHSRDDIEHWRRNQLNTLGLYLDAIQMRLDQGETEGAKSMIDRLIANLNDDNRKFAGAITADLPIPVPSHPPVQLLVVEDSDNERGLMTLLLASYGFVVHVARDGAEAFEQLQQWSGLPDIVLMDMQMPMFSGLEALLRIREDERLRDLTVYAVTGSRRVRENEPTGRGWDRWFAKPIEMPALVQAIQEDCEMLRAEVKGQPRQGVVPCPSS